MPSGPLREVGAGGLSVYFIQMYPFQLASMLFFRAAVYLSFYSDPVSSTQVA
jgi:hypothetical protein